MAALGAALAAAPALAAPRPAMTGIELRHGATLLRVDAIADDIVRVRVAPAGALPEDASWAVLPAMRTARVPVADISDAASAGFRTPALAVRVDRKTLAVTVTDAQGRVISADRPADPLETQGPAFTLRKTIADGEHFFGLGDKTGPLDRRGRSFTLWNTDAAVDETSDPNYQSIPFFLSAGGPGGAYGLLLDDTYRSWFDFGHRHPDTLAIGADGGPIDYYIIAGATPSRVVQRYADLTGKPPMPPKWAFGYQQSRYSYMSADAVRKLVDHFRADKFPLDVVWLDIDYQDRNRPFTTNPETFPDLGKLVSDIGAKGVKLVTITDLHIADAPNQGYAPYDSGMAGDEFVHNPDGSVFVGTVWPGPSVFPDFTRAESRRWWGSLYRKFVDDGVAGFWNDMNEPSVFDGPGKTMPLDTVHRIEGSGFKTRTAAHAEVHNIFGMENTRATYEGLLALRPDERPFVMTRASFAGGQRYATTWTGDNFSRWAGLPLAVSMTLDLGMSGFPYVANDVGGFIGDPSAELLTRWFEIATFMPLFRDHSTKGSPPQEPWVDGPGQEAIRRRYVEERYRLIPYIYALAEEAHRTGAPMMRPLFYDYPEMLNAACDARMDFTLGRDLLIAGNPTPESPEDYRVCLPRGVWYDYWTDKPAAPETIDNAPFGSYAALTLTPKLDTLPVFVRAGAIIPKQPLVQSLSDTPDGPLELNIWPGPDCSGLIYEDDGHSLAYKQGGYLRQRVTCAAGADGGLTIAFAPREGSHKPWWREIAVVVHAWQGGNKVRLDGKALTANREGQTLRFTLPDPKQAETVTIGS